jgi:hypothetical protein
MFDWKVKALEPERLELPAPIQTRNGVLTSFFVMPMILARGGV